MWNRQLALRPYEELSHGYCLENSVLFEFRTYLSNFPPMPCAGPAQLQRRDPGAWLQPPATHHEEGRGRRSRSSRSQVRTCIAAGSLCKGISTTSSGQFLVNTTSRVVGARAKIGVTTIHCLRAGGHDFLGPEKLLFCRATAVFTPGL